jgi:hypothetical protein
MRKSRYPEQRQYYFSTTQVEIIRKIADEREISESQVVREALDYYVANKLIEKG